MQFNSIQFMVFFPVAIAVYFVVPRKLRMPWLLVASYYFYMSWNPKYVVLIGFSTVATWLCGVLLEWTPPWGRGRYSRLHKNALVALCLAANLAILGLFKYGNFALEALDALAHVTGFSGGDVQMRFHYLLPVGISFYTFQALGYIIDVYRGETQAEKNFFRYALFVSFFPQLVAGPIERSKNLLAQMRDIEKTQLWDGHRIASGAMLMVWGFFMKMVVADRAAILVDRVFGDYQMYGGTELILAAVMFAIQIYCDFGSYSMIAMRAAKIMGFTLMENFKSPYLSRSIKDFWSRWHISLSGWFRDYLYIPLGGNRRGPFRKALNKLAVFFASGLWHGANWTFVVWGGFHGMLQVIADLWAPYGKVLTKRLSVKTDCFSWKLLKTAATFVLVDIGWVFFRSDSITDALRFFQRILIRPTPWLLFNGGIFTLGLDRVEMNILFFSLLLLFLVDWVRYKHGKLLDGFLWEQNLWFQWFSVIGLIVLIFVFGEYGPAFDPKQFIYFQF